MTGLGWSPDGERLVGSYDVCTREYCDDQLFTVKAEGGHPYPNDSYLALQSNEGIYGDPAWSPDGTGIAFVRVYNAPDGIYSIKPDGTGLAPLATGAGQFDPSWSPDGRKIAFSARGAIWVMNADGTGQTSVVSGPGLNVEPAWSPDGAKIAFASDRDDPNVASCSYECKFDIYVMDTDGTGQTRLTSDPSDERDPDWQPIPGPQRSDYKNDAKFCKAERDFLGEDGFRVKYGGGANAYGNCVSRG